MTRRSSCLATAAVDLRPGWWVRRQWWRCVVVVGGLLLPHLAYGQTAAERPTEQAAEQAAERPTERAAERGQLSFFEQKIRPVLIEHCYACHSAAAESLKGGLLLDSPTGWQTGGDSGQAAIVPGAPEQSPLMQAVRYQDGLEMPPEGPLPPEVIADLERWVRDGAFDPRSATAVARPRADRSWWSLQPLGPAATADQPASGLAGAAHIDDLVARKLAQAGLERNPPADPRTLIRRMSYDVLGLPPTPEQVRRFVDDYAADSQQATERLVDGLLASPHYGEQWGRHWLDVVRFGESNGFERNVITNDIWPFRDYVIRSLNQDKPFNQFIIEHLAGDVIGPNQPEVEIGAAFLVAGPYDDVGNQDVVAQANIRAATLDEIITATSGAFLGLTINCARCHHHKFDPIPTEDYYRLRAALEGVRHGRRVVATQAERERHAAAVKPLNVRKRALSEQLAELEKRVEAEAAERLQQLTFPRPKIDPELTEEQFAPVTARFVKLAMSASTDRPNTAVGGRLVEVEVWSAEAEPRNVALAASGARAHGARSTVAEDFPDAYGPQFTIDGQSGQQWFIGAPAELLIELPEAALIERVTLSNAKGKGLRDKAQGATPCEYEILVSSDGQQWTRVADSRDRQPWSTAHGVERLKASVTTPSQAAKRRELQQELAAVQSQLDAVQPLPVVFIGQHTQPTEATRVHVGGDPLKPGAVVAPASPSVLSQITARFELSSEAPEAERRLALARWIAADDNALTLRVLANRLWHYHFGTGIVDTPSDFGLLGGQPSHPELLDWLAGQLLAHQWRLKPVHRQILLSQTYRQSSAHRPSAAELDGESRLLWRYPPRRLSAEELRDTLLFVAGQLQGYISPQLAKGQAAGHGELAGGPGFRLYKFTQNNVCTYFPLDVFGPETYRRSVYHQNARASVVDLLSDFDLPDIAFAAPVRSTTTTPLQALTLLNHQFTLDMAAALAARSSSDASASTADPSTQAVVAAMYARVLQRPPRPDELAAASRLVEQHGAVALGRGLLNLNEVLYVE